MTKTRDDEIRERFAREAAGHQMTVLHDEGLYRHLRFRDPKHGMYWFDLITTPGTLIFQGDGESFVFSRIEDMFEFFRGPVGRINPSYWAEKLTSSHDTVMRYDEELFVATVKAEFVHAARHGGVPAGTGRALRDQVLADVVIFHEDTARTALAEFEHEGFGFDDTWEWSFRSYHWWFLWTLHAIVWGIAQYDTAKGRPVAGQVETVQVAGERL